MTDIEEARTKEREMLLASISRVFQNDPRILAFWLEGSIGRGTFDAWSDLDLWIVARDEDFQTVASERHRIVERMGSLVLTVEAPQNGPVDGIYLMAGFDCVSGIQLVDLYCQPASSACQPRSQAVLFIRQELAGLDSWRLSTPEDGISLIFRRAQRGDDTVRGDQPFVAWRPTPEEDAQNAGNLAWAMIAIQAKDIARNPTSPGLQYEAFIGNLVSKASSNKETLRPSYIDDTGPQKKLDRLLDISGGIIRVVPTNVRLKDSVFRMLNAVRQGLPEEVLER